MKMKYYIEVSCFFELCSIDNVIIVSLSKFFYLFSIKIDPTKTRDYAVSRACFYLVIMRRIR